LGRVEDDVVAEPRLDVSASIYWLYIKELHLGYALPKHPISRL
jgi:hypothetical protein